MRNVARALPQRPSLLERACAGGAPGTGAAGGSGAAPWRDEAYIDDRYDALAFFAADRLVQRAGEPAIFEYFRSLAHSESWREAFEGAFGVIVDGFYEAFEEHRGAFADLAAAFDGE